MAAVLPRRAALATVAAALATPALLAGGGRAALAQAAAPAAADPRLGERSTGSPDAPLAVIEYFSLTCGHCAAFHRDTWPRVKAELVDAGRVRMVWRDFPLDQLALAAAVGARALPPERYEAAIGALLGSQDRWAFARGADNLGEIARVLAVAGLTRAEFDAALADQAVGRAVLENRLQGEQKHNVNSTPSFVFGTRPTVAGGMSFERFAQLAREATPS